MGAGSKAKTTIQVGIGPCGTSNWSWVERAYECIRTQGLWLQWQISRGSACHSGGLDLCEGSGDNTPQPDCPGLASRKYKAVRPQDKFQNIHFLKSAQGVLTVWPFSVKLPESDGKNFCQNLLFYK